MFITVRIVLVMVTCVAKWYCYSLLITAIVYLRGYSYVYRFIKLVIVILFITGIILALTTCVARFWTLLLKMPPKRRCASQPPGGRAAKAPRRPAQRTTDTPVRGRRRSASATATVTRPEDTSVDTTADAIANAVLLRLEQSGRLLPASSPEVEVPVIPTPPPLSETTSSRSGVPIDDSDPEHFLDELLRGELPTQLPAHSIITRPLGSHISPTLRQTIIAGKYVNLSLLLQDDGLGDQYRQQVTLQLTPGQNAPHLAVVKPTHNK